MKRGARMTPINFDGIPEILRYKKQWTVWYIPEWTPNTDKPKKRVLLPNGNPMSEGHAITENLGTFEQVKEVCAKNQYYYPGLWLKEGDGLIFLDYDGTSKNIHPIPQAPSYCERSVYGYGFHILGWYKGSKPIIPEDDAAFTKEIYLGGRWIVMTGEVMDNRNDINDLTEYLEKYTVKKDGSSNNKPPLVIADTIKERHTAFLPIVGSMVAKNFPDDAIIAAIQVINTERCVPPKRNDVIEKEVRKIIEYVRNKEKDKVNEEVEEPFPTITDAEIQKIRDENVKAFKELPPMPEGFFKNYMAYGVRMSYAYSAYHFAGALALVSMIAGRKVAMKSTSNTIFTNVFLMIIGLTTISGKSTACDMFFDEFFKKLVRIDGHVEEIQKKLSPQALIQSLSEVPHRIWYYDECSEFFKDIQNTWASTLENIMCGIYDGRDQSYRLSLKKNQPSQFNANNVFLTAVFNTTTTEIENHLSSNSLGSGFVPRWMWFWMFCENPIRANRATTKEDEIEKEKLFQEIRKVQVILKKAYERANMETSIIFNPHPKLENWRLEDTKKHLKVEDEMHRVGTSRLMPQAYKIAMLFSLMDEKILSKIEKHVSFPLILDIPDEYASIALLICEDFLRPRLEHVMELSQNNDARNYQTQVIKCLKKYNGIAKRTVIQSHTRINKRVFDETLQSLEDSETIEIFESGNIKGRKGLVIKMVEAH